MSLTDASIVGLFHNIFFSPEPSSSKIFPVLISFMTHYLSLLPFFVFMFCKITVFIRSK